MKVDVLQSSFSGGEFAPSLFGRTDIAQYESACEIVENMLVRPYGPVISTPGTEFINECKTGGSTSIARLLNFVFSRTDSYVIELGVGYFRFYTDGAVVVSTGTTPYEVSHTYTASELKDIQFAQLNDVIYLAHPDHPPRQLTRLSASSWVLSDLSFTGGPFFKDNAITSGSTIALLTSATITPSGTLGSITLSASSNIFIPSSSTLGHVNTLWKINTTVTNSTTGISEQGFVQITAVTNPSTATATVIKQLKSTSATTTWAQGAWSYVLGWPARVTFHQQRLCFARTDYQPQNVWASMPFVYDNFAVNSGADDDAIDIQLASTEANEINWLASGDSLIAGTYGGEFAIKSGDDSPLTPANTNAFKQTSWGSEAVQPKRIGNFFYYIQRFARKLRELFYTWDINTYKSVDKTILSPHISGLGFIDIAYQQNPDTILWAVCTNGTIATLTREVDQEVQGWSRQTTDGTFESITSIPSIDSPHDEIWVIVKRTINNATKRYVERFKSQIVPDRQDQCFYVHSGLSYDAYAATNGLTATSISLSYPGSVTKLLLHFNGTNGTTTFTDSTGLHTISPSGNTQLSTSQKVFGTASAYFNSSIGIDSNTQLLLHLDNNITDSSPTSSTLTNNNVTFSSTVKEFAGYSGYFNGTNAYLVVPDSSKFAFGSGNFTFDTWIYFESTPTSMGESANIYTQRIDDNNGILFNVNSSGQVRFIVSSAAVTIADYAYNWVPSSGVFYHIALVRNSSTLTLYINGTAVSWSTINTAISTSSLPDLAADIYIGDKADFSQSFKGYLDEYRVSNTARYTSDFTPPTSAYSTNIDYLQSSDSADWYLGASNSTIHFRARFTDLTNQQCFVGQYQNASNYWYFSKDTNSNGNKLKVKFVSAGSTKADYTMTSSWGAAVDTWYHLALVRSSSTLKIYVDGVSQTLTTATAISTNDVGDVTASLIIGQQNSTDTFSGYLDEFVFMKGQANWTSDFTPPTTETSLSGTVIAITSSSTYFSAGNVGKRIRAINSDGDVLGEMTITGYTSGTSVIGAIVSSFDSFAYAAGLWGVSVSSISGLGHLEAKSVSVLCDGLPELPNKTVSGGTITLLSDYFYITAGLPYTQIVKTLFKDIGSMRGSSLGKIQRINEIAIRVNNSWTGFSVGESASYIDELSPVSTSLYSGVLSNIYFKSGYQVGAQVYVENTDPLPVEILSILRTTNTNDK